ncbi:GmrSD restriction endonuclease domain-containing protein [Micromonospora sp. LOL_024]|uniref:GmrSD restriction endonuclease domain-containing protein n=1 Tax=Micromonospora sp. LOL_024 TaxID=3345412 RepID=UPI003A85DA12
MVAAAETTLQGLLEGAKQYKVPLYQRTYSWQDHQLERLWEDIARLADDRAENPKTTHFIGSLVLAPSPNNGPAGVGDFLVVDGQQRLTTLSILLCAIRDHRVATEGDEHRDRLNDQYLINRYTPHRRLKLVPTQADLDAYLACVDSSAQVGGGAVGTAYQFFRGRLKPADQAQVQRLEDAVIFGLAVVSVVAQADDNVYRIFESLNNTGLKLTQADLLRNYLFMRLPDRSKTVYDAHWLPLQRRLSSPELEVLFWLDLVHTDPRITQGDTYARQQARLDRLSTEDEVEAEVRRFARLGALLELILRPEKEKDAEVGFRLRRLHAWGTTTVYPILLHLLDRRGLGTATSAEVAAAMRYLESFLVRRLLIGRATANINRNLLSIVTEMDKSQPVDQAVHAYLSAGRKYYATDADVRHAVRSLPFYTNGRASQRTLVLRWLEQSYGSKEPVQPEKLTIEHVLPQNIGPEWQRMLAADLEPHENVNEVHDALKHTLGNLTLSGYNVELGNSTFAVKRVELAKSGVRLTRDVVASERWGRPQIHARADALAELIIDVWPGPTGQAIDQSEVRWDLMEKALSALPAGAWTTYGDLAALIGTAPQPVGNRLRSVPVPNAHRVMQVEGTTAGGFRWPDGRTDDPVAVLQAEGIVFDQHGRADQNQRIDLDELAQLVGLAPDEVPRRLPRPRPGEGPSRADRFAEQLGVLQDKDVIKATLTLLDSWTEMGGTLLYGGAAETSCFLMARERGHRDGDIWPMTLYPSGKVEVVFQHMASRVPFDDAALREEFRQRLNQLPGVHIAAAKLTLRPGFPLTVLSDSTAAGSLIEHLRWFAEQAHRSEEAEETLAV